MHGAVGLLRAEEVICRAWDEAMNTQPNSFTWNLMGMLNNCNYRVKVRAAGRSCGVPAQETVQGVVCLAC